MFYAIDSCTWILLPPDFVIFFFFFLQSVTGVELRLANKIYTKIGFPIKTAYKELTATKFLSASQEVDFARSTEAAKTINDWCEEQTNHRIKDVIQPGKLDFTLIVKRKEYMHFKFQISQMFDIISVT